MESHGKTSFSWWEYSANPSMKWGWFLPQTQPYSAQPGTPGPPSFSPNFWEVRSVPLMQGIDWFMAAWWIERSSTELHWIMVTLLLLHKPLPICPITQKQNDNNTIYEIYIHDYKLILFGQTSSSSSLALQFPNSIYGIGLGILSIKLGDKCGGWWSLPPLAPTSTCVTGGKKML